MTEIILVRHGQANTHATDEAGYDRLSDLGRAQAAWLGAHLRGTDPHFDKVVTGTLSRQIETARAMGYDNNQQDDRLNELTYFDLALAVQTQFGLPAPRDASEFARHLPEVIDHWAENRLQGIPETFDSFSSRVATLLDEICDAHGRVLLVTSGGVIGMMLRHVLRLDNAGMAKVILQVLNSSLHRVHFVHGQLMLGGFNATPHLDTPDRAHARTFV